MNKKKMTPIIHVYVVGAMAICISLSTIHCHDQNSVVFESEFFKNWELRTTQRLYECCRADTLDIDQLRINSILLSKHREELIQKLTQEKNLIKDDVVEISERYSMGNEASLYMGGCRVNGELVCAYRFDWRGESQAIDITSQDILAYSGKWEPCCGPIYDLKYSVYRAYSKISITNQRAHILEIRVNVRG